MSSAAAPNPPPARDALPAYCVWLVVVCVLVFGLAQFGHLGTPLFWQDEGETAMFGRRILEVGYPKVHGDEGVVYGMSVPMVFGTDASSDAYTGSLWGQYYVAAAGVALSGMADDLHARTAWVRLPFALLGSAGLALAWLAYAPMFRPRARRWATGAMYWLGLAASVSLQLHLREVRYYALVVFCVGALLFVRQRSSGGLRALGVFAGLFLLFNSFYPAAVAMAGWIGVEAIWTAVRSHSDSRPWQHPLALAIAPVVAVALAVVPIVVWFDMLALSELMSARYQFGVAGYLANVVAVARHLALHEFLLAALLLRVAVALFGRRLPGSSLAPALWRLVLIWLAVGARNPIFFERYFVALGPVLLLAALLDFDRLRARIEIALPDERRRWRAVVGVVGLCTLLTLGLKQAELTGRFAELRTPVAGPLDIAIPWVVERTGATDELVIATNYESEVWMFYLGSRTVGRFHAGSEAEARAEAATRVDVVVPRRGYPHSVPGLRGYLAGGDFDRHVLEIADLPYNTIPELSPGRVLKRTHPFETVLPRHSDEALIVWLRNPDAEEAGR